MLITLKDNMHPEDVAMLQALLSRSNDPVERHLAKVEETGSGKFMQSFYVNYSHKSIADCGSTTLFFEGVSMLAAKAIQNSPLYNGQETSTRFVDMSKQPFIDPVGTPESRAVLERWMAFYQEMQAPTADVVRARHPRREGEDEGKYEKAVHARVQDILRAFLPAGLTTRLSCHMTLRQFADHLQVLRDHPLEEVRILAHKSSLALHERYSSSGFQTSMPSVTGQDNSREAMLARDDWTARMSRESAYIERDPGPIPFTFGGSFGAIDPATMNLLRERPRGCALPHHLSSLGRLSFDYGIDFGSFRDVQRHRSVVVRMPLLTTDHGFEQWYLEQMGDLMPKAAALIASQKVNIQKLVASRYEKQYYIPMGFVVPCELSCPLPGLVYLLEVRSAKTVHHTLRVKIHRMAKLLDNYWSGLPVHVDMDEDDWTIRRGGQTIERRTT